MPKIEYPDEQLYVWKFLRCWLFCNFCVHLWVCVRPKMRRSWPTLCMGIYMMACQLLCFNANICAKIHCCISGWGLLMFGHRCLLNQYQKKLYQEYGCSITNDPFFLDFVLPFKWFEREIKCIFHYLVAFLVESIPFMKRM